MKGSSKTSTIIVYEYYMLMVSAKSAKRIWWLHNQIISHCDLGIAVKPITYLLLSKQLEARQIMTKWQLKVLVSCAFYTTSKECDITENIHVRRKSFVIKLKLLQFHQSQVTQSDIYTAISSYFTSLGNWQNAPK